MGQAGFSVSIEDSQVLDFLNSRAPRAKAALKRAVRAAFKVIREGAMQMVPHNGPAGALLRLLQTSGGYKSRVDTRSDYSVVGTFFAKSPGNVLQSGFREHWAPLTKPRGGQTFGQSGQPLVDWFKARGLEGLIYRGGKRVPMHLRGAFFVRAQQGRPFVVPAAEARESAAVDAFNETMWEAIS